MKEMSDFDVFPGITILSVLLHACKYHVSQKIAKLKQRDNDIPLLTVKGTQQNLNTRDVCETYVPQ